MALRTTFFLLCSASFLFLVCESPYDPFNTPENAIGTISISSNTITRTGDIYFDTIGHPITLNVTVFLTKFINSGTVTLTYEDTSSDTILTSLFRDMPYADSRSIDTTITFLRGGTIRVYLKADISDGSVFQDSSILYLRRLPVHLSELSIDSVQLEPPLNDSTFRYSAAVPYEQSTVTLRPIIADSHARVIIIRRASTDDTVTGPCSLLVGTNVFSIITLADDDTTTLEYAVTVTRQKITAAALVNLIPSSGSLSPVFNSDSMSYLLSIPDSVGSLSFSTITGNSDVLVKINNTSPDSVFPLSPAGATEFSIAVTAEDEHPREYSITVIRKGNDGTLLSDIETSSGKLYPAFHSDTLNYELRVPHNTGTIQIQPASVHEGAVITVNGTSVASGAWSQDIPISQGNMTSFTIVVTPETGKLSRGYRIIVNRAFELTITSDDNGTATPAGTIDAFITVPRTLQATPDSGYHFNEWKVTSGKPSITTPRESNTEIEVFSSSEVQATFSRNRYYLSVSCIGDGAVSTSDSIEHGAVGQLTATAGSGSQFFRWQTITGSAIITDSLAPSTTVILKNGDATVQAIFATDIYQLTVTNGENGSVWGSGEIARDIPNTIKANPDTGYHFDVWRVVNGAAIIKDSLAATTSVTLPSGDATVRGLFKINRYKLKVLDGTNGSATGTAEVDHGDTAYISATPGTGFVFFMWKVVYGFAAITDTAGATTSVVLEHGDATITALFSTDLYQLTVNNDGHGTATGTGTVAHGIAQTIRAAASSNYRFLVWRVTDGSATIADSTADSTTVTLSSGDAAVTAFFTPVFSRITLQSDSTGSTSGSGSVTPGIAHTISATPKRGYHFSAWQIIQGTAVIDDTAATTTTVTADTGDVTIEAIFGKNTYHLTIDTAGNGTVTGPTTLPHGSPGSISATAAAGNHFVSWRTDSGSVTFGNANGNPTTVTLSSGNAKICGVFALNKYRLIVGSDGGGTVTPPSDSVDHGKTYPISATATGLNTFDRWMVVAGTVYIADSAAAATTVTLTAGNAEVRALFHTVPGNIIYVDSAAQGTNSGTSWINAYTDLQKAIRSAPVGSVIHIARGTYTPGNSRDSSFILKNGVKTYGGFPRGGGSRNVAACPTILSGDIQGDGTPSNNSLNILKADNVDSTVVLDGITVSEGYGSYLSESGGSGISLFSSGMIINNCTFSLCTAEKSGGAVYISGGSPVFTNCKFVDNSTGEADDIFYGGAVYLAASSPTFTLCIFSGNTSNNGGGAVYANAASPTFNTCTFDQNTSYFYGGALFSNTSTCTFRYCTFTENSGRYGGALYFSTGAKSSPQIIEACLFSTNTASIGGGAIMTANATQQITNSTFFNNSGTSQGGAVQASKSFLTVANCTFANNNSSVGSALRVADSSLTLVNSLFWSNQSSESGPLIVGSATSGTISHCVIEGGFSGGGSALVSTDSIYTQDPLLGTLGDYNGPVQTIPISDSSPARDKGTTVVPSGIDISKDARGLSRSDGKPDVGAFEVMTLE